MANRRRANHSVVEGSLIWVKKETVIPGTCRKLNSRWDGVYRVVEVLLGSEAAGHVKSYYGSEKWLVEPPDGVFDLDPQTMNSCHRECEAPLEVD